LKIRIKKIEVKTTRTEIIYPLPCCHNMGRVISGASYNYSGVSNWDHLRKAIKEELDRGKQSTVRFCPYCGAKIEWEESP